MASTRRMDSDMLAARYTLLLFVYTSIQCTLDLSIICNDERFFKRAEGNVWIGYYDALSRGSSMVHFFYREFVGVHNPRNLQ